jgi:hypothetical protein
MTATATELDLEIPSTPLSNAERQRRFRERRSNNARQPRNEDDVQATNSVTADEGVTLLCPAQWEVTIHFNEEGDAVLRQTNWPEDDDTIIVRRDNIAVFIDKLTDALGIPSFGRP